MYFLIQQAEQDRYQDIKLNAAFHGANFDEDSADESEAPTGQGEQYLFKHPDEYKHLSKEKRKEMTETMLKNIKTFVKTEFEKD